MGSYSLGGFPDENLRAGNNGPGGIWKLSDINPDLRRPRARLGRRYADGDAGKK